MFELAVICLSATMVVSVPDANPGANYETLAAELARLRTEVETLSSEIEDEKQQTRSQLRTLASQKSSLEAEIQREDLRMAQLNQALEEVQSRIEEAGALQSELKPAVLGAISQVRGPVAAGLPFRVEERVAELDRLHKDLQEGIVLPSVALSRLWTFVEDELRLTRENGLYRQVVHVSDEQILADVARVGMLMLYFRTPDQRYGRVSQVDGHWTYLVYQDQGDIEQTAALFESLEKRVRGGFFEIPNALGEEAAR